MPTLASRTGGLLALLALATDAVPFDLERALQNTAASINKTVPRPIGNDTYLESAVGYEKTLKYRFTFRNLTKDQLGSAFRMKQTEFLTDFVCTNPAMGVFVENDVTLKYAYYDKDGDLVVLISVDPKRCAVE